MSQKKRKKESPMPVSSAGLLRFFEDEAHGIKIRPEAVLISAVLLVIISVLLRVFLTP